MAKRIKSKELEIQDINKNTSKEISHTMKRLEKNEKKYTFYLVIFFMSLFIFIGYQSLKIQNNYTIKENTNLDYSISSLGQVLDLSKTDKISEDEIDNKTPIYIEVNNNTEKEVKYQIVLVKDIERIKKCGCSNKQIKNNNIFYRIDNKINKLSNDMILYEKTISSQTTINLELTIWVNKNENDENHFHGHIELREVK